jgi:hypothetical protein
VGNCVLLAASAWRSLEIAREEAVAQNMRIGKNILAWENLTFRHSGRAFEPESSVLINFST